MKSLAHKLVLLTVALLLALPLCAAEGGKKKGGKKGQGKDQIVQLKEKLEKANLTDEQKTKVKEVFAKFEGKIAEARKSVPPEVQKAMGEARKKAADEGKKGKELEEAVRSAVTLTEEQKAAFAKLQELQRGMQKELASILTQEQRDAVGLRMGREGGKKRNQ
jgi:Spy/CpxP family protein refolding chaperone